MKTVMACVIIVCICELLMIATLNRTLDSLRNRLNAQDDIISRIAGSQFKIQRELLEQIEANKREIHKVKMFSYRQSTMKEVEDDGTAGI